MNMNSPSSDPYGFPPPRMPPRAYRERGGCLNLWLGASILFGILALLALIQLWGLVLQTANVFQRISPVALILYTLLIIGMVVSILGIWNWKKWGVYGAAFTSIASPFIEHALSVATVSDWVAPFVQILILYYLVKDRWDDFDD